MELKWNHQPKISRSGGGGQRRHNRTEKIENINKIWVGPDTMVILIWVKDEFYMKNRNFHIAIENP